MLPSDIELVQQPVPDLAYLGDLIAAEPCVTPSMDLKEFQAFADTLTGAEVGELFDALKIERTGYRCRALMLLEVKVWYRYRQQERAFNRLAQELLESSPTSDAVLKGYCPESMGILRGVIDYVKKQREWENGDQPESD